MKPLGTCILLGILLLCSPTFSTQPFRHRVTKQGSANNQAFHQNLLKQLAASRKNATELVESISEHFPNKDGLVLVSITANQSLAVDSETSMQVYLPQYLPTTPSPPSACASALTASINCNSTITLMAVNSIVLSTTEDLNNVCTSDCATSLESYRSNVVSACQNYTVQSNNATYPPTYAVDAIIGPYTTQCLRDPTTQEFCSPLLMNLNTTGGFLALPNSELCTFCPLKTLNATLSNPATYSSDIAELLSDAITQCGQQFASYNVTSGPPSIVITDPDLDFGVIATNAFSTDCAVSGRNVTTTSDTTCSQLSTQYSVSDNNVLASNPFLDVDCNVAANTILCIPQACHTYTIQTNDTCDSVSQVAGSLTGTNITTVQLQSFNPELGTYCQLMSLRVGQTICLTPNGGFPDVGATSDANPVATPTTQAPIPTPTINGTTSNCGRYYQVKEGDICNTVVLANGVSLSDFLTLNPEIDEECTNLWLDYYYCVAPYPPFATDTDTIAPLTANFSSATIISFSISSAGYTPTFATVTLTPAGVPAPTNVAIGTRNVACGYYYTVSTGDTLQSIADDFGLKNSTDLLSWNPELMNGSLPVGSAICTLFPTGNYTLLVAPTPTNIAPNTTTSCADYHTVVAGDSCSSIETTYGLTSTQFSLLNPVVNAQCTNIVLGLAYCVLPLIPLSQFGAADPNAPPPNVAPGTITDGCTKYYTIASGDTCATIDTKFNITTAQFITMNPEVNSGCTNIALGSAYCVASNSTSSPGNGSIPPNVAAGTITAGCTEYYTVASGDTCTSIDSHFGITLAQFIAMNPEINSGCTNIALGSAYCVANSNSTSNVPSNVAAGTITSGCTQYYTVVTGDSCSTIDSQFGITLAQFITMNPEVNSGCTNIAVGSAYCVASSNSTSTVPSNVAPGTVTTGCTQYYTVVSGDSCSTIESRFGISLSQFITMNPEVNSGCTNIAIGLAYCVASSSSSTVPSNVAAGTITAGCTQYYTVVSGDSCGVIDSRFGITLAQFITMNPEVNSGCTNIIPGSAYCVASSNTTAPTGPPSNIATGSLTNCTTYYTVASGDNCPAIETRFHIAAPDFFRWNPEVNTACTNIQVGSAYCVTGGGRPCGKVYTVQSGDFCSKITTSQGITQAQLVALNPQLDANCDLNVGDNLCVG